MQYRDLRDFIAYLKEVGQLVEVDYPVDPNLEMTEISDRVLRAKGPALLFTNPIGYKTPVLCNLFGTAERIALALGGADGTTAVEHLRKVGELLAILKEPEPPQSFNDAFAKLGIYKNILNMKTKSISRFTSAKVQEVVLSGDQVDLTKLPIMTCWPEDVAPLITWGLTVTKGPHKARQNLGIYRLQLLNSQQLIMRWLSHRGGALDYREWQQENPGQPFKVSVVLGCDPATILAAVTPIPDSLSEYAFAGLLRNSQTRVVQSISNDLEVPADAEIVLEGYLDGSLAAEGPYGDHTGYYNEVDDFPIFTVTHITMRKDPIYHSTYTGRPPDEPAVLGSALNEVLVPILRKQFPEIVDFYLPPEGCSYRFATVSIKKQYPGHAKRIAFAIWSFLRQFMYTKFIVIVDDDVDIRNWEDVIWALTTRADPVRDCLLVENTPIDYLDFASPISGLGGKMAIDATNKMPGETNREWGRVIKRDQQTVEKIDQIWDLLNIKLDK